MQRRAGRLVVGAHAGRDFDELAAGQRRRRRGRSRPAAVPLLQPRLRAARRGRAPAARRRLVGRASRERVLEPLGMTPHDVPARRAPPPPGCSVHPYAGTLTAEPRHRHRRDGAGRPGVEHGRATSRATTRFLLRRAPRRARRSTLARAGLAPAVRRPRTTRSSYAYGLGFQLPRGGSGMLVGHTGSMPGFLAACFVDRPRRTGAVVLTNATTGLAPGGLAARAARGARAREPHRADAVGADRARCRPELADVLGLWHWGNTPSCSRSRAASSCWRARRRRRGDRFALARRPRSSAPRLPRRRDAARRTPRRRVGEPPRVRDVRLHPHAVRPRGPDPGRPPGSQE